MALLPISFGFIVDSVKGFFYRTDEHGVWLLAQSTVLVPCTVLMEGCYGQLTKYKLVCI